MNVSLKKVKPGSVLARPVTNAGRQVLLGVGLKLTARHIEQLQRLGVESIVVEGDAGDALVDSTAARAREARLDQMFKPVIDEPHMKAIAEAARPQLRKGRDWER